MRETRFAARQLPSTKVVLGVMHLGAPRVPFHGGRWRMVPVAGMDAFGPGARA